MALTVFCWRVAVIEIITKVETREGQSQMTEPSRSIMERFTSTFSSKALWNVVLPSRIHKIDMRKASRFVSKIDFGSVFNNTYNMLFLIVILTRNGAISGEVYEHQE
ncbi:hypothetical protein Bca101_090294 [Brassica carinata]